VPDADIRDSFPLPNHILANQYGTPEIAEDSGEDGVEAAAVA
jgi:hypothetical protein